MSFYDNNFFLMLSLSLNTAKIPSQYAPLTSETEHTADIRFHIY